MYATHFYHREAPKTPTKPISSASESTSPSMKAFGFGGLGTLSPKFASQPSTLASTTSPNGMKKSISSGHIPALARVDPVSISDAAVIPSSGRNGGGMTRSKSMMTFGLFQKK